MNEQSSAYRKFGFVLATGFIALAALVYWRKHELSPVLLSLAGGFATVALVYPPLLGPVQRVWLKIGAVLGYINARILLSIIYFALITPIALFLRIRGRRPLTTVSSTSVNTYWRRREERSGEMERQF